MKSRISLLILMSLAFVACGNNSAPEGEAVAMNDPVVAGNPLLEEWDTPFGVPPLDRIKSEDYLPAIRIGVAEQAAEIDAKIFGPQALILNVYWCMCGAPFDLEATPNFAAKLEEAGLDWPPPSPIKWPLKDW